MPWAFGRATRVDSQDPSEFAQDHRRSPRAGATGLADQGDQQRSGKGDTRPPR
ncbi:MAG: hypothetical protein V3U95_07765 [Dehalococcoidia bacterium]